MMDWFQLKNLGNTEFKAGRYAAAENSYTAALARPGLICQDKAVLYTNRATARIKLGLFQEAIWDCDECLKLDPNNAKAKFRMAEAQYAIGDFQTALDNAQRAYQQWNSQDLSTPEKISELIGRCRKARWEQQERVNRREITDLEREVMDLMQERKEALQRLGPEMCDPMDWKTRLAEMDRQKETMLSLFEATRLESEKKKPPPPDWALCPITLCVMTDPYTTPSGRSFDRLNLLQHLKNNNTCPISREPMTLKDIRPNIQLREACEEYLKNNGWAADY